MTQPAYQTEWEINGNRTEADPDVFCPEEGIYELGINWPEEKDVLLRIRVPSAGIHYRWTPKLHLIKGLNSDWFNHLYRSNAFTGAPAECLIGADNYSRAAAALSETLYEVELKAVQIEETAEYGFEVRMERTGSLKVRLDLRILPYERTLEEISVWWERQEGMQPAAVPESAFCAMYSTWYSYHQQLAEENLLKQCRMAAKLGCRTILLDDGWQTEDHNRGYAYCGDWRPAAGKIPDMRRFVEKAHALGMKVMLWYSVPFLGEKSVNFKRFKEMLIDRNAAREWHVLDPRYPEVRQFITGLYTEALEKWDVDGFKLDFVDEFVVTPFDGKEEDARRDYESVVEAADFLMKGCIEELTRRKPDIMLEFRQTYNGPRMRAFGNIFRAVDCPFDVVENHVRVTDIRLLAGGSAVHSDMLMWDQQDTPENAALQLIQVMFSVPQISMRLEELPESHWKMLSFYMHLWEEYKSAFLHGSFSAGSPILRYPVIIGVKDDKMACTIHAGIPVVLKRLYPVMLFLNGSSMDYLLLDCRDTDKRYRIRVFDCMGGLLSEEKKELKQGIHMIRMPQSGAVEFKQV